MRRNPGPHAPHQLIDIRDPEESYSAGDFVRDAEVAIAASLAQTIESPCLAGGTMMYFRALTQGIAQLPQADDASIRAEIDALAAEKGMAGRPCKELSRVDPEAAESFGAQ